MRRVLPVLALALTLAAARGVDKPSPAEEFKKLQEEIKKSDDTFEKELKAAKTVQERARLRDEKDPAREYAPKLVAFARKHKTSPEAFDALVQALAVSGGPQTKDGVWSRVLETLRRDHVRRPEMGKLARVLTRTGDENTVALLRAVIEQNPSKKVQAQACRALAETTREAVEWAARFEKDPEVRKKAEQFRGKDFVERVVRKADQNRKEYARLTKLLRDKYADLVPDLSVGKPLPDVELESLEGRKIKPNDLKGKVVVLSVWATWCDDCKKTIPHARKLVERTRGKPFAYLSASVDEDRDTVARFLKTTPMPWLHAFDGPSGTLVEEWDLKEYPAVFVIDAKGVIRYKDVLGRELDEAVDLLLKEVK